MKSILLVDDQPHVIRVLKMALENAGYQVSFAHNGKDALDLIVQEFPGAMITDISMPMMTGRELCQTIHQLFPDRPFPIFVMTSMTERSEREWTAAIDNIHFLEKPLSPSQLTGILDSYFA